MRFDISKILNKNTDPNTIEYFRLIDSDNIVGIQVHKTHEIKSNIQYHTDKETKVVSSSLFKSYDYTKQPSGFYNSYSSYDTERYYKEDLIKRGYRIDENNVVYNMTTPTVTLMFKEYQRDCYFNTDEEAIDVAQKLTYAMKIDFITIE